ncbi:MtrB/PioB family decaheme-associated outer membrane protein [Natronospira sp.]|uniref:MtrB/PioB family decaheme-associated outer membrane protein n=1 Tax=Natronospira sp. TaxID=2024970 RepID=UPI003873BB5A
MSRRRFAAKGLVPFCLLAAGVAMAETGEQTEEAETGQWHELHLDLGLGVQTGQVDGMGRSDNLSGEGLRGIGGFRMDWRTLTDAKEPASLFLAAEQPGPGITRLDLDYNRQGEHRTRFNFRELPRRLGDGRTPFLGAGGYQLGLPEDWVGAPGTGGMERLTESLRSAAYEQLRRSMQLAHERRLSRHWQLHGDVREHRRTGTRPVAAVIGSTGGNSRAALVPAPVDYTTREAELGLRYQRDAFHLEASYFLSLFDGGNNMLRFDNPFAGVGGWAPGVSYPDGQGHLGLMPDNESHQWRVGLGYVFSPTLRLSSDLQIGRSEQDEDFLGYTINPNLDVDEALPRDSLEGRIDLLRVATRLNWRPMNRLRVDIRHRYEDRDNRTPVDVFNYIGGDAVNQNSGEAHSRARLNLPVSFTEQHLETRMAWRLDGGGQVHGAWRRERIDRDFSEVGRTEEDRFTLGLRQRLGDNHALSMEAQRARRSVDDYDATAVYFLTRTEVYTDGVAEAVRFDNHPLLRRYNLADRNQTRARMRWDWTLSDSVHFGSDAAWSRDNYRNSPLGLEKGSSLGLASDLVWQFSSAWSTDTFLSLDRIRARQRSRSFRGFAKEVESQDPDRDWWMDNEDRIATLGGGLEWEPDEGDFKLRFEWAESASRSEFAIASGPALDLEPIPSVRSRGRTLSLNGQHRLGDGLSLQWNWYHDRFRSNDWAWDDVEVDTINSVIGSAQDFGNESVNWYSLSLRWDLRPG